MRERASAQRPRTQILCLQYIKKRSEKVYEKLKILITPLELMAFRFFRKF